MHPVLENAKAKIRGAFTISTKRGIEEIIAISKMEGISAVEAIAAFVKEEKGFLDLNLDAEGNLTGKDIFVHPALANKKDEILELYKSRPKAAIIQIEAICKENGISSKAALAEFFEKNAFKHPQLDSKRRELCILFNSKPKEAIQQIKNICEKNEISTTAAIAAFFIQEKFNLDLGAVSEYLGKKLPENQSVLKIMTEPMDFKGMDILSAFREYAKTFLLLGESQTLDTLVENFGKVYYEQNQGGLIANADAAQTLSYTVFMLQTDLHNPNVSQKMTSEQMQKYLRGTNGGKDFNKTLLTNIYNDIAEKPFDLTFRKQEPEYELQSKNLYTDPAFKFWENILKTTGKHGKLTYNNGSAEVEIQIYKPNILAKHRGEEPKIIIKPADKTQGSLELAANIAAEFNTNISNIKATYAYEIEDMHLIYEAKKVEAQFSKIEKAQSFKERLWDEKKKSISEVKEEKEEIHTPGRRL